MTPRYARIAAVGSALPSRYVTNAEMEKLVDTTDEWIVERTGIRARHFVGPGETVSSMGADAGRRALEAAGIDPSTIDLTVVATCTEDQPLPSAASLVQQKLGITGAAFDLEAACAGFIYSLDVGSAMIAAGRAENVLIIGSEVLSSRVDFTDRTTCVLFGDGAGAAVLTPGDEPGVLGSILENDGRHAALLQVPAGGSAMPESPEGQHLDKIQMQGREVFKRAVVGMADAASRLLDKSGFGMEDVTLLVPHQANARIIKAVADRLHFPMNRMFVDLEEVGNTSAASVPIAMDHAWRQGRIQPGDLVLTVAFGAGLAWGANLIRWTAPTP